MKGLLWFWNDDLRAALHGAQAGYTAQRGAPATRALVNPGDLARANLAAGQVIAGLTLVSAPCVRPGHLMVEDGARQSAPRRRAHRRSWWQRQVLRQERDLRDLKATQEDARYA